MFRKNLLPPDSWYRKKNLPLQYLFESLGIGQGSVVDCTILGDDPSYSIRGSNFFST
jgi:hypothetical protein